MAPQTGAFTTSRAPTPSFSASAATACTAPTSTPTYPLSPRTTGPSRNSFTIPPGRRGRARHRLETISSRKPIRAAEQSRSVADQQERYARRSAVLRGRRLDSDHDAGRPDPGILRAHEPVGTGVAPLLPRVRQTRAGGRGEPSWVPSGVAFRPPAAAASLTLCLPGRGDIPVLRALRKFTSVMSGVSAGERAAGC